MCLWSQRAGDPTWEPSRLPGLKWAGQMPSSSPAPLIPKGPSHLPLLISLVSFLRSQDPHYLEGTLEGRRLAWELSRFPMPQWAGQTPSAPFPFLWSWRGPPACLSCSLPASLLCLQDQPGPEGTSEGIGPSEPGRLSQVIGKGKRCASSPLIGAPKDPSRRGNPSPISATPQGCWSCRPPFLLPPQSPQVLLVRLWVLPVSLGIGVPHQCLAGALPNSKSIYKCAYFWFGITY